MYRLAWLMGLLGWTALLPAQDRTVVQPDGTRITTHQVSVLGALPAPRLALEARGGVATIVLPRETVDRLAARDEHAVENRISRLDFLASGRARERLKLLAPGRDRLGCQPTAGFSAGGSPVAGRHRDLELRRLGVLAGGAIKGTRKWDANNSLWAMSRLASFRRAIVRRSPRSSIRCCSDPSARRSENTR